MRGLLRPSSAPWVRHPEVQFAWATNYRSMSWVTGATGDGAAISSLKPDTGAQSLAPNNGNILYRQNLARQVPYLELHSGSSCVLQNVPVGTAFTGTAKPMSIITVGATPNSAPASHYLWFFGNTSNNNRRLQLGSPTAGTTHPMTVARKNDAGTLEAGSAVSLGTGMFIHSARYSGGVSPTLRTIANNSVIDNNVSMSAGGPLTLNTFSLGGEVSTSTVAFSDPSLQAVIIGTMSDATIAFFTTYINRLLAIF